MVIANIEREILKEKKDFFQVKNRLDSQRTIV